MTFYIFNTCLHQMSLQLCICGTFFAYRLPKCLLLLSSLEQEISKFLENLHFIVMIHVCKDDNPKTIQIEFDTGSLMKKDVWRICNVCSHKQEFSRYKISEKIL